MEAVLTAPTQAHDAGVGTLMLRSSCTAPVLELCNAPQDHYPFRRVGPGRFEGESTWLAEPRLPESGLWQFRVALEHGLYDTPLFEPCYETALRRGWLQDKQLFAEEPAPYVSSARVVKLEGPKGHLEARPLYVYLPRGYDESEGAYPVIYMHDGQNCFEAFVGDSYAGSWRADWVANRLIAHGQMLEAIIVGVGNGREARMAEYLPPYASFRFYPQRKGRSRALLRGEADRTARYYQEDVRPYLAERFRIRAGREHAATVGSSMGGLFSWYLAFDHPEFAAAHAAMSSTFWITNDGHGHLRALTRLQELPKRDLRLWLDSGEGQNRPGGSDDNKYVTMEAREALQAAGYEEGRDFVYYLAEGARHHETDWAARLDLVFRYLMPPPALEPS